MLVQLVGFPAVGVGVYLLSLLLRCKSLDPRLRHPRRSATNALISVAVSMSILTALMLPQYFHHKDVPAPQAHEASVSQSHGQTAGSQLASGAAVALVFALPAFLFMWRGKESLHSAGVSSHNLFQATLIGVLLSLLTIRADTGSFLKVGAITLGPLLYYASVGFGEEFLFRGYLQTRLVAWRGVLQGWILASVMMALVHLPGRLFVHNVPASEALGSCLSLIPVSLLMGFIMLRTGNIITPALFHLFGDYACCL